MVVHHRLRPLGHGRLRRGEIIRLMAVTLVLFFGAARLLDWLQRALHAMAVCLCVHCLREGALALFPVVGL